MGSAFSAYFSALDMMELFEHYARSSNNLMNYEEFLNDIQNVPDVFSDVRDRIKKYLDRKQ